MNKKLTKPNKKEIKGFALYGEGNGNCGIGTGNGGGTGKGSSTNTGATK